MTGPALQNKVRNPLISLWAARPKNPKKVGRFLLHIINDLQHIGSFEYVDRPTGPLTGPLTGPKSRNILKERNKKRPTLRPTLRPKLKE